MIKNYHAGDLMSPALKELCDKKLERLDKYADDFSCEIYMSTEGKEHVTKMVLTSKKFGEVVAKSASDDMYKNLDVCVDSLKLQLSKEKPVKKHSKHARFNKPDVD